MAEIYGYIRFMSQPPIRYRQQPSNWPPRGTPPEPVYAQGPGGSGPNWTKRILLGAAAVFAVLIVAVLAAGVMGGGSSEQVAKPVVKPPAKSKVKPNSWSREYGVSLQFMGRPTNIRGVRVDGLNRKTADVVYTIQGTCGSWVTQSKSWVLSIPKTNQHPYTEHLADRITQVNVVGGTCTYQVAFRWPSAYTRSSMMTVRMNNGKKIRDNITLWLQVPESHQGVETVS